MRKNGGRKYRFKDIQSLNFPIILHKFGEAGFLYYLQNSCLKRERKAWILHDSITKASLFTRWILKIKLLIQKCKLKKRSSSCSRDTGNSETVKLVIIFSTNYTKGDGTSTVIYFLILLKATTDNNWQQIVHKSHF